MPQAYPLQWPSDWKRTAPTERRRAAYKVTDGQCLKSLEAELRRIGASNIVISTNIQTKPNGLPYVNQPGVIEDPGVAVYYSTQDFKDRVIAGDKWQRVYHNAYAIAKALEALRAVERSGATQILDRIFSAFGALPAAEAAPKTRAWWDVLQLTRSAIDQGVIDLPMLEARYRTLAKRAHPDAGGAPGAMAELNEAMAAARRHFG